MWATAVQCRMPEADLHRPVEKFFRARGYEVKGETGRFYFVALRGEEGPVVVELAERLTLALVLRGVDRLSRSGAVYVACRAAEGGTAWGRREKAILGLLRISGLGLLTVSEHGGVVPVLDPAR